MSSALIHDLTWMTVVFVFIMPKLIRAWRENAAMDRYDAAHPRINP